MINRTVKPFRFYTAFDGTRPLVVEDGKMNTVYKKNSNPKETFRRFSLLSKILLKLRNINVINGRPHDSIFE